MKKIRILWNAPVTLCFVLLCCIAFLLQKLIPGSTYSLFSVHSSSLADPLTYLRLFGHTLGHADLGHIVGNMMYILLLGPLLEEKHGSFNVILTILITAFITGIACMLFSNRYTVSLGASGVVFAFILLASFTEYHDREIPVTTILVGILFLGKELQSAVVQGGNVGYGVHILGGIIGALLGFYLNKCRGNHHGHAHHH